MLLLGQANRLHDQFSAGVKAHRAIQAEVVEAPVG
jgi:hypothetical protein